MIKYILIMWYFGGLNPAYKGAGVLDHIEFKTHKQCVGVGRQLPDKIEYKCIKVSDD